MSLLALDVIPALEITDPGLVDLGVESTMHKLEPVYRAEEIQERIRDLGEAISRYYGPTADLLVIGLLKGCFIFLADLVRHIRTPHEIAFLGIESYGDSMESSGRIEMTYDPKTRIRKRSVLLVDDIIDSGHTMNYVVPFLEEQGADEVQICVLLHKRISRTLIQDARWVGFDAPKKFLVGYGLGVGESLRHLPHIAAVVE